MQRMSRIQNPTPIGEGGSLRIRWSSNGEGERLHGESRGLSGIERLMSDVRRGLTEMWWFLNGTGWKIHREERGANGSDRWLSGGKMGLHR